MSSLAQPSCSATQSRSKYLNRSNPLWVSCWSDWARICYGDFGATACIFIGIAMATTPTICTCTAISQMACRMHVADHAHMHRFRWRSLLIGLMHGLAGSAALIVLAATQVGTPLDGVLYVLLFGIGSMVGMGALSAVIAVPLVVSAHRLTWANRALQVAVGMVTVAIGLVNNLCDRFCMMEPRKLEPGQDGQGSNNAGHQRPNCSDGYSL